MVSYLYNYLIPKQDNDSFNTALKIGNLELAKWLYNDKRIINNKTLCHLQKYEYHEILSWIGEIDTYDLYSLSIVNTCIYCCDDYIRKIIDSGIIEEDYNNMLYVFFENGRLNPIKMLLEKNPDLVIPSYSCWLSHMMINGYYDCLKWFLEQNSDNNYMNVCFENIQILFKKGHFNIIKWLYETQPTLYFDKYMSFTNACLCNNLEIAKWLYENFKDEIGVISHTLENSYISSSEIIFWLIDVYEAEDIYYDKRELFIYMCQYNNIEIVKHLIKTEIYLPHIDVKFIKQLKYSKTDNNQLILLLFKTFPSIINEKTIIHILDTFVNNLEIIKYIFELNISVDYSNSIQNIFTHACLHNNANTISWLVKQKFKLELLSSNIFYRICTVGHVDVCKWLCSYMEYKPEITCELFSAICQSNNLEMAQWLYSKNNIIVMIRFDKLNVKICKNNKQDNLELLQWLHSLNKITDSSNLITMGMALCINDNLKSLKWFYKTYNDTMINNSDKFFEAAILYNHIDILNFIIKQNNNIDINKIVQSTLPKITKYNILLSLTTLYHYYPNLPIWSINDRPLNVPTNVDYINFPHLFTELCKNKILSAKFIYAIAPNIINKINKHKIFLTLCTNNSLEYIEWFYSLVKDVDMFANDHEIFRNACRHNTFEVAQYIASLIPQKYSISRIYGSPFDFEYFIKVDLKINNKIKYNDLKNKHNDDCIICYENADIIFPCKLIEHNFCYNCTNELYNRKKKECNSIKSVVCPLCRSDCLVKNMWQIIS